MREIVDSQGEEEFIFSSPRKKVIFFGSLGCSACVNAKKDIEKFTQDLNMDLAYVEISNPKIKVKNVISVPTFVIYNGYEFIDYFSGYDKNRIASY